MRIPTDPKERFQYYFDITTGLDEKYQEKIDKISTERFDYDPEDDKRYKKGVAQNADNARRLKEKYAGEFATLSQGYDNSMQTVVGKKVEENQWRQDNELYNSMYDEKHREWMESKEKRIRNAKKRYATLYGNAYNNMLRAGEDIAMESAK